MCELKYFAFSQHSNNWWMTCCHFPLYFLTKALHWLILDQPTHKINPSLLHYHVPSRLLQGVLIYNQGGMYEPWNNQGLRFWFDLHFKTNPKVQGSLPMLHKIQSLRGRQLHSTAQLWLLCRECQFTSSISMVTS